MAVKKKTNKKGNENLDEQSQETQEQAVDSNNQEDDAGKEDVQEQTPEEKYNELNNRFMRLYAEFENFRKRTNKERIDIITNANADLLKDIITNANADLLKDLIPVIDDFERAISNNEDSEDVVAIKEGFSLIYNKYTGILKTKGLKPMEAKGEVFDPEVHEAVANMPTEDKKLKGKIIDDVEKGYLLNDKVLRYAKVVVGQ